MSTKTLYFRVDFDFLTTRLRDFWAEGSYQQAIDFGLSCGLGKEHVEEVIRGKMKMIQDPNGKEGADGTFAEDNWTPNLDLCHYGKYPDPNDMYKMAAESVGLKEESINNELRNLQNIAGEISIAYKESDMATARDLWNLVDTFPKHIREQVDIPYSRKLAEMTDEEYENVANTDKMIEKQYRDRLGILPVEEYVQKTLARDKRETPKPTKNYDWDNGWLLPNGNFYPCEGGTMEHIWLADRLGKEEKDAEKAGWIKLGKGMMGVHISGFNKKPTKKQFTTLFDWAEHKKERDKEYKAFIKYCDFGFED